MGERATNTDLCEDERRKATNTDLCEDERRKTTNTDLSEDERRKATNTDLSQDERRKTTKTDLSICVICAAVSVQGGRREVGNCPPNTTPSSASCSSVKRTSSPRYSPPTDFSNLHTATVSSFPLTAQSV